MTKKFVAAAYTATLNSIKLTQEAFIILYYININNSNDHHSKLKLNKP